MHVSAGQRQALERGEAVMTLVEGIECVVLRRDVYERIKSLLEVRSEIDVREFYPLIHDAMRQDDANDPWLDAYQEFRQ